MNEDQTIFESNESDFEEKVLKASSSKLILVDFWAPWCGPCKQLTPILEKVVKNANKKVHLVKINIDENQQIASQMRIQSIPAVFVFKDGQPIDAFQGVIPENKIIEFIEKSLGEKLSKDHKELYNSVIELMKIQEYEKAINIIESFITENTDEYQGLSLYLDCLVEIGKYEEADSFSSSLSEEAMKNTFIKSSLKKLLIKKNNINGPTIEELLIKLEGKPKDLKIIIKLTDKYFTLNMLDEAFELLLKNFKNNQDNVRKKILELFEALGNDHLKTIEYRKKLSSIMFS